MLLQRPVERTTAIVAGLSAVTAWTLYFVDTPSPASSSVRLGPGSLRVRF